VSSLVAQPPALAQPRQNAPVVPQKPAVTRTIDAAKVAQALVGITEGCDVCMAAGSVSVTQPRRREPFARALSEAVIAVSLSVLYPSADNSAGIRRAEDIADRACGTVREAQLFLDLAVARVEGLAANPKFWQAERTLCDGGDFTWTAPRDQSPLVEIAPPAITINLPQQPPAVVNVAPTVVPTPVNVTLEQPDKTVTFTRGFDGNIIEATTSGAA
jgi:hypothetical protein